jgi:CBS domain protein/BON domain-containing protein
MIEPMRVLSEADLIHRAEIGTERHRSWWLEAVTGAATSAAEFAKDHGEKVGEIMTPEVVSVAEDTPLSEIAALLERKRIKRVPVVRNGKLVGIVSRIDQPAESDRQIRLELLSRLEQQPWTDFGSRNVTVGDHIVHLRGLVGSPEERKALLALAESVPGVTRVCDEMISAY